MSTWKNWAWKAEIDWSSPPAKTLDVFTRFLAADRDFRETTITVFGSAPLEMCLSLPVNSADVDTMSDQFQQLIQVNLQRQNPTVGMEPHLQFVMPGIFRPAQSWALRAERQSRNDIQLLLPHPIDLLFGKLHRLAEKDFLAFDLLRERFQRPSHEDIDQYCKENPDIFLSSPEEVVNLCNNIEVLCGYYRWELIPVQDYAARALQELQKIRAEGKKVSRIREKLIRGYQPPDEKNRPKPRER